MKRPLTDSSSSGESSSTLPKRAKSGVACANCRRQKTRCEQLDNTSESRSCHRCKVLGVQCSFFDNPPPMSAAALLPPPPQPALPTAKNVLPSSIGTEFGTELPLMDVDSHRDGYFDVLEMLPRPITPWGFTKVPDFDWTAQPMLAITELARRPIPGASTAPPPVSLQQKMDSIKEDKVHYLLNVWESKYAGWINLPPDSGPPSGSPLFTLARCAIASRHLDPTIRSNISPVLQSKVQTEIYDRMFYAVPSVDLIKATFILSMWSPLDGGEARDGRLIAGAAVSMAMNLNLSHAAVYAASLQEKSTKEKGLSAADEADLESALVQARLWLALSVSEAMMCLGTGRKPLSQRSRADVRILPPASIDSVAAARDTRLGIMVRIVDLAERGISIPRVSNKSDIDRWHTDVLQILVEMDSLLRLISPLLSATDHEQFHFEMIETYYQSCRFLIIHHSIRNLRASLVANSPDGEIWFKKAIHNGVNLVATWCQEALSAAEGVLVRSMPIRNMQQLSSAPDSVYVMINFAAAMLVLAQFAIMQGTGQIIPTSTAATLVKVSSECLEQISLSEEHMATKCSRLIRAFLTCYNNVKEDIINGRIRPQTTTSPSSSSSSSSSTLPSEPSRSSSKSTSVPPPPPPLPPNSLPRPPHPLSPPPRRPGPGWDPLYGLDLPQVMGVDEFFQDPSFWARTGPDGQPEFSFLFQAPEAHFEEAPHGM